MFLWKQTWTTANRTENAVPDNFRLPTHFAEKQPTCFPIIEKNPPFSLDATAVKTDFHSGGNVGARFKGNIYSGRCDSQTDRMVKQSSSSASFLIEKAPIPDIRVPYFYFPGILSRVNLITNRMLRR
ncbi:hypothetical protein CEXT_609331 [Caerostris extrusa]|uniref:Uncharacterized protein n=1 Tax=Caerostris extrusa TaxID=172846 RepID=A0AAV4SP84_CAEEX|nr:hypothetical protein CEXT_609331 [Caerostris extrusa]